MGRRSKVLVTRVAFAGLASLWVSVVGCASDPTLVAWCPTAQRPAANPPSDPIGGEARVNASTALDQLTMTHQDIYLGAWWDASANTYVLAASDGHHHDDVVRQLAPQSVRVIQVSHSRSFFAPARAALFSDPTVSGFVSSAVVDAPSELFRITLNDVSLSARQRVSASLPISEGVCVEPEAETYAIP
jgi:hypothetical protein